MNYMRTPMIVVGKCSARKQGPYHSISGEKACAASSDVMVDWKMIPLYSKE